MCKISLVTAAISGETLDLEIDSMNTGFLH